MRLFHLLHSHDTSKPTGVPRFSGYFKLVFPEVINITPANISGVEWKSDDVVVCDNHYSLMVPEKIRTVVVHHGCAVYHYEVDASWRNYSTEHIATGQRLMFHKRNRLYVAPSAWVRDRFKDFAPEWYDSRSFVLPHWVPVIPRKPNKHLRKVVIGDFRNPNKGSEVFKAIEKALYVKGVCLKNMNFSTEEEKINTYQVADAYLCLSLSEGAPYSVADAEAASLVLVSTEVGNCKEFDSIYIVKDRDDINGVCEVVEFALESGRPVPSYYNSFSFDDWSEAWKVVINEVQK